MFDKYVKLQGKLYDETDSYCPVNEKGQLVVGLTLIGFCDGEVIGDYDMDTMEFTPKQEKCVSEEKKQE